MIYDSLPYRRKLLAFGNSIEKRERQVRWSQASLTNLELESFSAFFIVRKLIEANKIPLHVSSKNYKLTSYAWAHPKDHKRDANLLDEYYQLNRPRTQIRQLRWIANQFIHSYYFAFQSDSDECSGFSGILINTDQTYQKHLYLITTALISEIVTDCQEGVTHGTGTWVERQDGRFNWSFTPS